MASSWRIRKRSSRPRGNQATEDYYRLDHSKSPHENAYDIYVGLCSRETNETKRLSYLNALAVLLQLHKDANFEFTTEEFLYCLSASLAHQFTQVRAATLRTIRHLLTTAKDVQTFNALQLPFLVCRSIDVLLRNDDERVQALKLVRKLLSIAPQMVSPVLVRCLISLGESGVEESDRMLRACLATLCEFGVLNGQLLIVCGGVSVITRNVLECHSPRIAESLCGVLLHLLEWPQTRNIAGVRLECLAAPYCDFTYRLGIMDKNKDARELRYTCSRLALLSVLRSWAGTIEFCDPNKPSGLKAIVDVLYLNQLEVRKAILDLLYELLGLPQPIWTDEYSVALATVDPSDFQDAWRLSDGFVAMEGRSILPSLASRVPNICEQHLSLLLYCFLETGLINALVEVIVSSDTFISVRSTVLIGKILQLMHVHLPADICSLSSALPSLVQYATEGNSQAKAAISALQSLHQMLRNRPASCSLFLDSIIQGGALVNSRLFRRELHTQDNVQILPPLLGTIERRRHDSVSSSTSGGGGGFTGGDDNQQNPTHNSGSSLKRSNFRSKRKKLFQFFESLKEIERLIKDSNVLLNQDGNTWDWEIIIAILRSDAIGKLDDSKCRFLRRLVHYFKPSSNRFSHQDLAHSRHFPAYVTAGLDTIDWLIQSPELESMRLLTDLFSDISGQLLAISTARSAHDCLFSPQHMSSTMCQQYFIFIGRMCRYEKGLSILTNTDVFKQLQNLVTSTNHVCYIKLIVSGLDYSLEAYPRKILEKALTLCKLRDGRLYATQFMLVLLRAKVANFEVWGLPLVITQTKDAHRSVILAALEIVNEACHDRTYLEEIVSIWHDFKYLGDDGELLMCRYYSIPRGLNHPNAQIVEEIDKWKNKFIRRYVLLIEAETHANLTLHVKNEDGFYSRRTCSSRPLTIPLNIQPHLYGQLIQTEQGTKYLKKHGNISEFIGILTASKCETERQSLELKSALWVLGHLSTNNDGVDYLNDPVSRVYEKIISLAKNCPVYSIRATAFSVLGLAGSSNAGANALYKLDWCCVRHNRNTLWPVCEPEESHISNQTPMRHTYDEMPPYNYTGIGENINGFNTSSESNSLYFDDTVDSKENTRDDSDSQLGTAAARSRTLPESGITTISSRQTTKHHTRSLSESKTTDVISIINEISATHQQQQTHHRTRFNSGTDSNTSGVSSCESVYGRNILTGGELTQTPLSPIPSSSNLLDLTANTGQLRRISLIGTAIHSYRETSISPQDLQGYATLRSLGSHRRPVLSESAANELADILDHDLLVAPIRSRKFSLGESQRKMKVRSLDRHHTTMLLLVPRFEDFQVPLPSLKTPKFLPQNDTKGPVYSGICLPKNILDLFPQRSTTRTYVSKDIQDMEMADINQLTPKQQMQQLTQQTLIDISMLNTAIEGGEESAKSSLSDVSSVSRRGGKWGGKHNRAICLHCSRSRINRLHPTADSDINISKQSILSDESMPDRVTASILHHVKRMANPVSCKQSKISLLELKQKHTAAFQDICLYSEVCRAIGQTTYRMNARRFLQELFLDLHYDSFYCEPNEILSRKEKELAHSHLYTNSDDEIINVSQLTGDNITTSIRLATVCSNSNITPNYIIANEIHDAETQHAIAAAAGASTAVTQPTAAYSHVKIVRSPPPPLESLYEDSHENLSSDSVNSKTNSIKQNSVQSVLLAANSIDIATAAAASEPRCINRTILHRRHVSLSGEDFVDGGSGGEGDNVCKINRRRKVENQNSSNGHFRPRFNTFDLHLSSTQNKFPITDKRKSFSNKSFNTSFGTNNTSYFSETTTPNFDRNIAALVAQPSTQLYCEKRLLQSHDHSRDATEYRNLK